MFRSSSCHALGLPGSVSSGHHGILHRVRHGIRHRVLPRVLPGVLFGALLGSFLADHAEAQFPVTPPRSSVRVGFALGDLSPLWSQSGLGPVEVNQSVGGPGAGDGTPITIGGRVFSRGLGTHATSVIAYDIGGTAFQFSSWVGIDDAVGANGSATFEVWADGTQLFDSGLVTGNDAAVFTGRLNVRGARELLLVVRDGGDGAQDDHADWADPVLRGDDKPVGDGAPLRRLRGSWGAPMAWPLDPLQAAVLESGDLLTFASAIADGPGTTPPTDPHDTTRADLSDPATFGHTAVDHPREEVFGGALARDARGSLFTVGGFGGRNGAGRAFGQDQASRFDPVTSDWIPAADGPAARHGASGLTLGSGYVLAVGGAHAGGLAHAPARFDGAGWGVLEGAPLAPWLSVGDPALDGIRPFVHLAPDGQVLVAGWDENMGLFDTRGPGEWTVRTQRESIQRAWGSAASIAPERLLLAGGVDHRGNPGEATRTAIVVDVSGASPVTVPASSMTFARADHDATILADGTVLLTGGSRIHAYDGTPETDVRVAELYDPALDTWTLCAAAVEPRGYGSTALLLPDGRVWTGGGACGPGRSSNTSAEVFTPPYLYGGSASGQLAPRPVIQSMPEVVAYGDAFAVQMANGASISRLTLVRLGSAAQGVNTDQRFLELPFTQTRATLDATAPADGNVAPPGHYMLFAFDAQGVPSVARIVRFELARPTAWEFLASSDGSDLTCRHEAAMVEVDGKLYLMGGRGSRPVEEYDPVTGRWRSLGNPPFEVHHFQPVVLDGTVYVVGAFSGGFPNENNVPGVWTWEPVSNVWTQVSTIPAARRRGSAGTFVRDGKIYLVCGNNQGHNGGARPWFDEYDPVTQSWTALPDAPRARDHFLSVLIGDRLVLAGGRRTDLPDPFDNTVPEVDVYDFGTGTWSTLGDDLPTARAGTMAVPVGRYAVVVGGESDTQFVAHDETEALDVVAEEWVTLPDLARGRHSGGIGVVDGRIYVASGSGNRGGTPELDTLEVIAASDALETSGPSLVANGSFDRGLAQWATTPSGVLLVQQGAVAAPAVRLDAGVVQSTRIAVQPQVPYSANALFTASGGGAARLEIRAFGAGGANLGSAFVALPAAATLQRAVLDWTTPPGTQEVVVRIESSGGRVLVIDDVVLTRD
ncbi:MAG: NPCBM/NEW2 domain-containing protein [Planctomycetota bacterium]